MSVGEIIQIVRLAVDVSAKSISAVRGYQKEQQLNAKNKEDFSISLLQKSALCIQLGVEHLLEHIHSNRDQFHDYLADYWCKLLENATLASGETLTTHIAGLPFSVAKVIPDLVRLMNEESSESITKSKELFQIAFLLSSNVFKMKEKNTRAFLILSLASCLKISAAVLRRLDNLDLMSMSMKSTVHQLEERSISLPRSSFGSRPMQLLQASHIRKCIFSLFLLISQFIEHFQSHNKRRLRDLVDRSMRTGLLTHVNMNILLPGKVINNY